ncbi:MAG: TonB-dependent receptor [Parahaliea sp.]
MFYLSQLRLTTVAFIFVGTIGHFPCALAQKTSQSTKAETLTLEHILVIGEKTERTLKDTSSSVSVISEQTINSLQNYTLSNAVAEVPNIVVSSGSAPNIRGVNGNGSAGGFNSITGGAKARVTTVIDGIAEPFVADQTGDSAIWDIRQIEVFRGPQSTSFGRNSIGGMIYITTKDPDFDREGAIRIGYRNRDRYLDGAAMISGPIIDDKLAFRVSAEILDAQTLTDDTGYATNKPDYDLNQLKSYRVRSKLLWAINENLQTLLTYSINNEAGDAGRIYVTAENPLDYKRIWFRDIETDSDTLSLKTDYYLSDYLSLDLLVAYNQYQWIADEYMPNPADEQYIVFDDDNTTIETKLNFEQSAGRWNGFIGLAYFERKQDFSSQGSYEYTGKDSSDSEAIYGEFTYNLNEQLHITAGLRIERESQDRNFNYISYGIISRLKQDDTLTLPKLALLYDISEQTTLGLSARKGYNAPGGALNFTQQSYYYYDKEEVSTYEASIRSDLANGRINLSANLFYNDYDGYQALNSLRTITNMNKVTTYGLEMELRAQISDTFELTSGLGLLKSNIDDGGKSYQSVNGNELSTAPGLTGNIGLYYYFSNAFNTGLSARYVGEYFGDIENTAGQEAGGYTLARLSSNYVSEQWQLSGYINNLFNEKAYTVRSPANRNTPAYAAILDPRTIGLALTYHFN